MTCSFIVGFGSATLIEIDYLNQMKNLNTVMVRFIHSLCVFGWTIPIEIQRCNETKYRNRVIIRVIHLLFGLNLSVDISSVYTK
jgi:hypothetical protein